MSEFLYFQDWEDKPGAVYRVKPKGIDNEDFCVWNGKEWVPSQEAMDAYWWDRPSRSVSEEEAKKLCEEWTKYVQDGKKNNEQ